MWQMNIIVYLIDIAEWQLSGDSDVTVVDIFCDDFFIIGYNAKELLQQLLLLLGIDYFSLPTIICWHLDMVFD